jgi:hypothetical protein
MRKIALVIVTVTLSACASTREESAIAFQQQLPQLVADCNTAFRDGTKFGVGIVAISEGIDACDRLAKERSLSLVDATAIDSYQSYKHSRALSAVRDTDCSLRGGSTSCFPPQSYTPALQQPTTWPDLPPGPATAP